MKVLVTGEAGFIGSHTIDLLLKRGYEVKILDSLEKPVHLRGKPSYIPPEVEFIEGDVRCREDWPRALEGVEAVFHTLADVPSEGTGLGSSSSVTVGLLNALYAYAGELVTAERLAREACEIEVDILGEPIGKSRTNISPLGEYLSQVGVLCAQLDRGQIERLVGLLLEAWQRETQIFIFGNGGSAATASHFCEDLGKGTLQGLDDHRRFRVISLTDNVPYIMAWANDEGCERVFEQQLANLARPGDLAVGISGSGNSENVLRAIRFANEHGLVTVGLTGFDGGQLCYLAQYSVHVPYPNMGMVENIHLVVDMLRERLGEREVR